VEISINKVSSCAFGGQDWSCGLLSLAHHGDEVGEVLLLLVGWPLHLQ
jgi:hypothetical protein